MLAQADNLDVDWRRRDERLQQDVGCGAVGATLGREQFDDDRRTSGRGGTRRTRHRGRRHNHQQRGDGERWHSISHGNVFYSVTPVSSHWLPKSVLALRQYSRQDLLADLLAGLTVGLVALPLAMAFAISSGVKPESGIYCAIVAGFLISALGGSRHQIGGPTGAFVVVVAGIVATYGLDGLFMCTMMAGVLLILLGATGMGTAVRFIPRPVVVGFTVRAAVFAASGLSV